MVIVIIELYYAKFLAHVPSFCFKTKLKYFKHQAFSDRFSFLDFPSVNFATKRLSFYQPFFFFVADFTAGEEKYLSAHFAADAFIDHICRSYNCRL